MTNLSKGATGALVLIKAAKNYGRKADKCVQCATYVLNGKGWVGETGRGEEVGCGSLQRA